MPLISDNPSLACNLTGFRPASVSASKLVILCHPDSDSELSGYLTMHSPSPNNANDIWESGAKSPEAPRDPILGTTGAIPEFIISISISTISGRIPDTPLASEFALNTIIRRTCSGCIRSPMPQAWLLIRFVCRSSRSLPSIRTEDIAPNPVLIPYTTSSDWMIFSIAAREADIAALDWSESTALP